MGKPTGFKEHTRELPTRRPVELRILDWEEVYQEFPEDKLRTQGARCMDCGIPFCHNGCPLGNIIPEWNDLVYKNRWADALEMLFKTNNFPEFTGRVCPAPCEEACVLGINDKPVTIKLIEQNIIDYAFNAGWIKPKLPETRTGKKVAIVGSGPAGLAAAAQLNKVGHVVTVFERADRIGGLLVYGIPNFKLDKKVVDRRVKLMEAEGIVFKTNANVGFNVTVEALQKEFDAILLCGGATHARDLNVPGRELKGIHPAMDYLPLQNKRNLGDTIPDEQFIDAKDKHVIILGGGDTGADCLGTATRQGCASVKQFELLPRPPEERTTEMPWPYWPMIFRTSSAHEEATKVAGGDVRDFAINTKSFSGENGAVKKLHGIRLEWGKDAAGRYQMKEVAGSEFTLDADLVLLAMGFIHPEHAGPIDQLGLKKDARGNVVVNDDYATSVEGVFSAGDMRRGQSLVVWAISEGRSAAYGIDKFLSKRDSDLPYLKLFEVPIKETDHIAGWMLILRKRWFWRVLMDSYGIVIFLCFGSAAGLGAICMLFGLITGRGLFADEVSKTHGLRDWGTLILELLACSLVFYFCYRWSIEFLADMFLPGRVYEGPVGTIRRVHISGTHGGYDAWILTCGELSWEIFHSDLKHTLQPGDVIRVHYRRGTKAITHMWQRYRHS